MIRISLLALTSLALISCGNVATKPATTSTEPKPLEYIPPTNLD